ncbi:hypothetical protein M9H77_17303 [Catharanthus roseus]|uniref:Uncharacterized protein n=1 Tax=Catharanthus roseus TaxID=4058 RepID=A0ACC0B477_CATRO|nr:hypothetical protein M9H77_17303 [Catharanthus roseus]
MTSLCYGFGLCPWSPTVAFYVLLNSGVEAALMCLDSLRLPSCARTPQHHHCFKETTKAHTHVDSLSVRAHDGQRYSKPLKLGMEFLVQVSPEEHCCPGGHALVFETYSLVLEARRYLIPPQLT